MQGKCPFCRSAEEYLEDGSDSLLINSRLLRKYSNFYIVPSLGPLENGHILIISERHVTHVAEFTKEERVELQEICDEWQSILEDKYGLSVCFFQHGVVKSSGNGCVDHFHLHAFPQKINLFYPMCEKIKVNKVQGLGDIVADVGYLYIANSYGSKGVCYMEHIPSQLIRQIYCLTIGEASSWDWREYPKVEAMTQTYIDLMGR